MWELYRQAWGNAEFSECRVESWTWNKSCCGVTLPRWVQTCNLSNWGGVLFGFGLFLWDRVTTCVWFDFQRHFSVILVYFSFLYPGYWPDPVTQFYSRIQKKNPTLLKNINVHYCKMLLLMHWHLSLFHLLSSSAGWISWSLPSRFSSFFPWRRPGRRPAVPPACPHLQPSTCEETHLLRGTAGQPEQTGPTAQTAVC